MTEETATEEKVTEQMRTSTGGEALVRALAAHGVSTAFGIPGTHNLEIYRHRRRTASRMSPRVTSRAPGTRPTPTRA